MSKGKYIQEVTYVIDAQTEKGRFTIPDDVRKALNIASNESPPLYIRIWDDESGELLLSDPVNPNKPEKVLMTSGTEIVDRQTRKALESKQRIRVTISRAD